MTGLGLKYEDEESSDPGDFNDKIIFRHFKFYSTLFQDFVFAADLLPEENPFQVCN